MEWIKRIREKREWAIAESGGRKKEVADWKDKWARIEKVQINCFNLLKIKGNQFEIENSWRYYQDERE